jgi:hypothetical protein
MHPIPGTLTMIPPITDRMNANRQRFGKATEKYASSQMSAIVV